MKAQETRLNARKGKDETEIEIQQWTNQYLTEIDRIESFFKKNLKELKNEFRTLESQYNSTKHVDEMGNLIYPSNVFHRSDTNDSIQIEEIDVHVPKFSAAVAAPLIPENSNKSYRSSIKDNLLNQRS